MRVTQTGDRLQQPVKTATAAEAAVVLLGLRGLVWVPNCDFIAVQPYNSSVLSSSGQQ
jgi:hypothetical protein